MIFKMCIFNIFHKQTITVREKWIVSKFRAVLAVTQGLLEDHSELKCEFDALKNEQKNLITFSNV